MMEKPQYRTTEEKVRDIERYLIRQVDAIRRWVLVAVSLAAVAALASLWMAMSDRGAGPAPAATSIDSQRTRPDPVQPVETAPSPPSDDAARTGGNVAPRSQAPASLATRTPAPRTSTVTSASTPAADPTSSAAVNPASTAKSVPASSRPAALATDSTGWAFRAASITVSTGIQGMQPVGTGDRFPATTPRIYCWSRIETVDLGRIPPDRRYVVHRWYRQGHLERSRKITIGASSYRAWSSLSSPGEKPGDWRVDVVDAEGHVLGSLRFSVESGS